MKTADSQTHSQQHRADQSTSSAQGLESAFFSERSPSPAPFFPSAGFSGIQSKLEGDRAPFFQPTQVPHIQAKCGPCAAEKKQAEAPELQRMPAFESDDQAIQAKMMSGVRATTVQRMSAFESDEAHLQRQSLPHTETVTATSANLQAKCAACETEQQEKSEEHNEGELQVQRVPTASSPNEGNNEDSQPVQFSLKIGQPGDAYEREADAMADRIVNTPKPESQNKLEQSTAKIASSKLTLQPKSTSQKVDSENAIRGDRITNQLKTSKGKGSSLDESIRSRMEPEFGANFSPVRIHTDSEAVQLNQDLGAQAFTHGSDIYFNNSKYNPHSKTGERLLAHELTHTVQQGAIPTSKSNHGIVQTNLIQRDTECEAEKEKRGSKEQAQQAETASNVGDCRQTNSPAEKPPEGTKEPEQQETPANIEAREGAPVDERQRNAPPPNENAPEGEKGIAETAKQTKPTASQEPCAVREAARAGVTDTGTTPAPRSISASGVKVQSANTPATGTEVNSFLVEAVQGTATNLQPEGLGEAASPDVATERDELSVSADEALAMLNETSSTTAFATASGLRFIAPIQQTDDPAAQQQALADHQSASSTADTFISQAGQRLNNFIAQGIAATETLRAGTAEKEVVLMAQIQQRSARTQALMEQLRTSAQARAQAATQKIEARHLETIIAIDLRAMAAQAKLEPTYEEQAQQLEKAQKDQMTRLNEVYQTGYGNLLKIGREKGQQSMARAGEHKRAYRQAEGAPSDIQRRVRNRKKDGFWDGYLTYNRYMARADAAKKVGEEYRDGFQKEAQAQADNMMCGKSRDIETTQTIIDQSLESLGCARNNAIDSIANQRQFATDMAERARQEATNTLQNALRATLNQLNERETGQLQLIQDYGIRQEIAIERDSERAIGAVLKGVNDAASQVLQYLSQFRAQIEATEAPPPDIFAAQLAIEEAQLTASFDRAQTVLDQSLNQAQTSLDTGQLQALGALEQLYQRGANEAQQLVSSFHQTAQDLVAGTMNGYDQTLAAYDKRITSEITNSTQIFQGVVAGAISVFARINTGIESKFQQSASQMQQGMQQTLDDKLDQKVCSEAEKAASDVHPWWKTVLKVLLIIVVIVVVAVVLGPAIIGAVGAAATTIAGSLGAGAALAGTIGAWIGPIIGGAIVGAIAGAAIQLGSNAIYNKPLTEGLWGAIIAGAIGGALGGVGGQLGQVLVGRFASTAFSRIAVQYGTDVVFDVVGGILGDLAAGNPITWESIVMGLAIGGAVQLSMGGLGSLAGRSHAARSAGAAAVPEGFVGRLAQGRLGRAAERITDLQKGAMAAGERFGARVGGRGGRAPTAEATSEALASARARMERGEAFPTRGGQELEGFGRQPKGVEPGRTETGAETTPPSREFSDSTDINDPRVRQEVEDLGPMTPETRQMLTDNPRLRQALIENPAAARAFKKCASPCFPPNATPELIRKVQQHIVEAETAGMKVDYQRLNDYLYQNRNTLDRVSQRLDNPDVQHPFATIPRTTHQVTVDDILSALPTGADTVQVRQKVSALLDDGVSSTQLADIMRHAVSSRTNADDLLSLLQKVPQSQRSQVLYPLSRGGDDFADMRGYLNEINSRNLWSNFDEGLAGLREANMRWVRFEDGSVQWVRASDVQPGARGLVPGDYATYQGRDVLFMGNSSQLEGLPAVLSRDPGSLSGIVNTPTSASQMYDAPPVGTSLGGHAFDDHGVTFPQCEPIVNNPERVFSGIYPFTGRHTDVYYRDGSVVITEHGNKNSIITAFGRVSGDNDVPINRWAGQPGYIEIPF